jgi:hypothetical protein
MTQVVEHRELDREPRGMVERHLDDGEAAVRAAGAPANGIGSASAHSPVKLVSQK